MNLEFKENKREDKVDIFQCKGITRIKIAYYDKDKRKVVVPSDVRKQLKTRRIDLKEYCNELLGAYQEWERSNSPLRHLSKEQLEGVVNSLGNVNILCICLQDEITKLSVLNKLDHFNEVAPDLQKLKDSLMSLSDKMSKILGVDQYLDSTEVADAISELLKEGKQLSEAV